MSGLIKTLTCSEPVLSRIFFWDEYEYRIYSEIENGPNTNIEYIRETENIRIIKRNFVNKLVPHFGFNTYTQI